MWTGGSPCMARAASRKIHVQNTNGKVNELTFHGAMMRLNPVRTHVVRAAQSTNASHIQTVLPRNVGNAQPTSTPLNPHSPWAPSSRQSEQVARDGRDDQPQQGAPCDEAEPFLIAAPKDADQKEKSRPSIVLEHHLPCAAQQPCREIE